MSEVVPEKAVADLKITYDIGQEFSPSSRWGRNTLVLEGSGRVTFEIRDNGWNRSWEGRVEPALVERVLAGLRAAGFPAGSQTVFVPGGGIALLAVRSGAKEQRAEFDYYKMRELAGYKDAIQVLDSLGCQMSGGLVKRSGNWIPPSVSELRQLD